MNKSTRSRKLNVNIPTTATTRSAPPTKKVRKPTYTYKTKMHDYHSL